jgi:membrane associated rhomboid family serine protease
MIIFPYSTALRISTQPVISYTVTLLCLITFWLQLNYGVTESIWYLPQSWNPLTMISSSLAHGGYLHLFGNLVFFMAFTPALEVLVGDRWRFVSILVFIAFITGSSYSLSVIASDSALPSLGLSGVVMGMIGLSAFLMPRAKIKVFWWYIVFWKTFYVPAWAVAIAYIGYDFCVLIFANNFHGINMVAHVAGGIAGYGYGYLWLKQRREEISDELDAEIEAMHVRQKQGATSEEAFRYQRSTAVIARKKQEKLGHDKFMKQVYQCVKTDRNNVAINLLLDKYDTDTPVHELEESFKRIEEWGPSRAMMCFGRLLIIALAEQQRFGRVLVYIEKCQKISPKFVLADLSNTLFYAKHAIDVGKSEIAKNLLIDAGDRYGNLVNLEKCEELLHQVLKNEIDIIL